MNWSLVKDGALRLTCHQQLTVSNYGGLPFQWMPINFGFSLDNPNLARTAKPRGSEASNNGEGDDVNAPIQGLNRKRTALQQAEALRTAPKFTKHKSIPEDLGIIAISDTDSDTPLAPISRKRLRRSPVIKVENAFTLRMNTPAPGPPDDGVLDPDTLKNGDNGQPMSRSHEESSKAVGRTLFYTGPRLDASDLNYDQVTHQSTPLDSSLTEGRDSPSLPCLTASPRASREKSGSAPKPNIQTQYFIITARTPRLAYTLWPEGTLRDKTLGKVFDEVATYTWKKHVQKIVFKVSTSQEEVEYPIHRGDENTFEDMRRAFNKGLRADRKKGITKFKIWLEPDPAGQRSTEAEMGGGSESEDDIV